MYSNKSFFKKWFHTFFNTILLPNTRRFCIFELKLSGKSVDNAFSINPDCSHKLLRLYLPFGMSLILDKNAV